MTPTWYPETVTTRIDAMVDRALLWGLEGLELGSVGGVSERVPNINERRLTRKLRSSELGVASIVPGLFRSSVGDRVAWMNDLALLTECLGFCRRFDCSLVVVSSFAASTSPEASADVLRRAGDLAAPRGVRLAVLNERNHSAGTGADLAELLERTDHPAVVAAWDPVAGVHLGENAVDGTRAVAARAGLLRFATDRGDGTVDWKGVLHELARCGFDGPVSLVLSSDEPLSSGLDHATDMIRLMRSASGGRSDQRTSPT